MPDKQTSAAQSEPGAAPGEFNFTKPASENPRIRRRSLKMRPEGLKPSSGPPPAARELEREAPPLSADQVVKPKPEGVPEAKPEPVVQVNEPVIMKTAETPISPPRNVPMTKATTPPSTTASTGAPPRTSPTANTGAASAPVRTESPHGTRPATLYYSSTATKDKEALLPMKTTPTPSPASSVSTTTLPASTARPSNTSARPAMTTDYRANVERQSREQKSVGNILAYVVYALIGLFVVGGVLAIYGADVIFERIHDQSVTVNDLDQRYASATKDISTKLATTQDTLSQVQTQVARQQELIVKQQDALQKEQEQIGRLLEASTDNTAALRQERQARAQETTTLRARVKDLENKGSGIQKF